MTVTLTSFRAMTLTWVMAMNVVIFRAIVSLVTLIVAAMITRVAMVTGLPVTVVIAITRAIPLVADKVAKLKAKMSTECKVCQI